MNWKHSLYEIYAISFGQAFLIDEAYRILHELREDRMFSIASSFAETKRAQAKVIDAKLVLQDFNVKKDTQANARRSEAALLETEARFIIAQPCLDMARVELSFIESLIKLIDDSGCRLYDDFAVGSQLAQTYEFAYEYAWALMWDGSGSDLMRNIFAHPDADVIIATAQLDTVSKNPSRKSLSNALAEALGLDKRHLAISVNAYEKIAATVTAQPLLRYAQANDQSTLGLQEKINAVTDPSRDLVPSSGATSVD